MKRIVLAFAGPPCCGKSTVASEVARRLHLPHVSSGDLIRELASSGDAASVELARRVMDGTLAPSPEIVAIVEDRISRQDCLHGFVLDGFPRKIEEARIFLDAYGPIDAYVFMDMAEEALAERAATRARGDDGNHSYRMDIHRENHGPVLDAFRDSGSPVLDVDASDGPDAVLSGLMETMREMGIVAALDTVAPPGR